MIRPHTVIRLDRGLPMGPTHSCRVCGGRAWLLLVFKLARLGTHEAFRCREYGAYGIDNQNGLGHVMFVACRVHGLAEASRIDFEERVRHAVYG